MGSSERVGKGASFKSVVVCSFFISVYSHLRGLNVLVATKPSA